VATRRVSSPPPDPRPPQGTRAAGSRSRSRRTAQPATTEPTSLKTLLADTQAAAAAAGKIAVDSETWRDAVGDRIAAHARPGRLRRGVLTVYASSSVWAQELTFLADELVCRLKDGGVRLSAVRLVVGGDQRPRDPCPARRALPQPAVRVPLPKSLQQRLAGVDDPQLRRIIAEAAASSLAMGVQARSSAKSRAAPTPRSAAPGSARPAQNHPGVRAASKRTREGRRR
jgi:hypothetical protein